MDFDDQLLIVCPSDRQSSHYVFLAVFHYCLQVFVIYLEVKSVSQDFFSPSAILFHQGCRYVFIYSKFLAFLPISPSSVNTTSISPNASAAFAISIAVVCGPGVSSTNLLNACLAD